MHLLKIYFKILNLAWSSIGPNIFIDMQNFFLQTILGVIVPNTMFLGATFYHFVGMFTDPSRKS